MAKAGNLKQAKYHIPQPRQQAVPFAERFPGRCLVFTGEHDLDDGFGAVAGTADRLQANPFSPSCTVQ
jgi:hypothetical protein